LDVPDKAQPIVYVVDDDESVRQAFKRLLSAENMKVQVFESALEFLDSKFTDRNACLIADIKMPGLTGLELRRRLADQGSTLPMILITGLDTDETRAEAQKVGVAGYFRKPIDAQALLDAIRWALSKKTSS
jgi:FixJ family two-component response regulator